MKEQILFNQDNSGDNVCRTIKTTYHKISTANLIRGGGLWCEWRIGDKQ